MRRGNMGHLTRIANAVVRNLERGATQSPAGEALHGEPAAAACGGPRRPQPGEEAVRQGSEAGGLGGGQAVEGVSSERAQSDRRRGPPTWRVPAGQT